MANENPRNIAFSHPAPGWAAEGVEPSAEFKAQGYTPGYKPPAGYFNWFWTLVSQNLQELQTALSGYAAANELDKTALSGALDAGGLVHEETTASATARGFSLPGADAWANLLNRPVHIRAAAAGTDAPTTLALNGGAGVPLQFPQPGGALENIPPANWVAAGGVYTVVWDGQRLLAAAQNPPLATTQNAGPVKLVNSYQSASTAEAPTAGALKSLYDMVQTVQEATLQKAFPVGSYYMTATDKNPASILGFGAWARAFAGKSPVGVDTADTDFSAAGKTGGAKTVTLTAATIPSHAHSVPQLSGTAETAGNHWHDLGGTMGSAGAHTHANAALGSWLTGGSGGGSTAANLTAGTTGAFRLSDMASAGAHTHSLAGGWTDYAGPHTHGVSTLANTTGNNGSGGAHNNMHPYETVYFWKRTA